MEPLLHDRQRLEQDPDRGQARGQRDEEVDVIDIGFREEAVQPPDAAFQGRLRREVLHPEPVVETVTGPPDRRDDERADPELRWDGSADGGHPAQVLVADDQHLVAVGSRPEQALGDLLVGSAEADPQDVDQDAPTAGHVVHARAGARRASGSIRQRRAAPRSPASSPRPVSCRAATDDRPGGSAVRAGDEQRQADEVVPTGVDGAQVEALDDDDPGP